MDLLRGGNGRPQLPTILDSLQTSSRVQRRGFTEDSFSVGIFSSCSLYDWQTNTGWLSSVSRPGKGLPPLTRMFLSPELWVQGCKPWRGIAQAGYCPNGDKTSDNRSNVLCTVHAANSHRRARHPGHTRDRQQGLERAARLRRGKRFLCALRRSAQAHRKSSPADSTSQPVTTASASRVRAPEVCQVSFAGLAARFSARRRW